MPRKDQHLRRGSRAAEVLNALDRMIGALSAMQFHPNTVLCYGYGGFREITRARECAEERRAVRQLHRAGHIAVRKTAKGLMASLTQTGKHELFRLRVMGSELYRDGRMCMVVFDIPESERKVRKMLRNFLGAASFVPIQKSVWISPFNAGEQLRTLFSTSGVTKWVRIYEVRDMNSLLSE